MLRQYHARAGQEMTPLQVEFFRASVKKERQLKRVRQVVIAAIAFLSVCASIAAAAVFSAYRDANTQKAAAQEQAHTSLIRSVVAYAYKADAQNQREQAALIARHAYLLNQQYKGKELDLIEDALRTIFRTDSSIEEPDSGELAEQVCEKVNFQTELAPDEWREFVEADIPHEAACPK